MVERCLCKADVSGSSPLTSTENIPRTNQHYGFRVKERVNAGKSSSQNLENCIEESKGIKK